MEFFYLAQSLQKMFGLNELGFIIIPIWEALISVSVIVIAVEFSTHKYTRQYHYSGTICIRVYMTILLNVCLFVHHVRLE